MKEDYFLLLGSGMFWEFHPELTGKWNKDKEKWAKIWTAQKNKVESKGDSDKDEG